MTRDSNPLRLAATEHHSAPLGRFAARTRLDLTMPPAQVEPGTFSSRNRLDADRDVALPFTVPVGDTHDDALAVFRAVRNVLLPMMAFWLAVAWMAGVWA